MASNSNNLVYECNQNYFYDQKGLNTSYKRYYKKNRYKGEQSTTRPLFDETGHFKNQNWHRPSWSIPKQQQSFSTYLKRYSQCNRYNNNYRNLHNFNNSRSNQISKNGYSLSKLENQKEVKSNCVDNINSSNIQENNTISEKQKKKTPISLLNEWTMHCNGVNNKKKTVSYTLIAVKGHAHKPIFTYLCCACNKSATGQGQSKKEAKQNAASRLLDRLLVSESSNNREKIISTKSISTNSKDDQELVSSSEIEPEKPSEVKIDLNDDTKLTKYDAVQIAHCNMNPIGTLQELCTAHRWAAPFYSFEKLNSFEKCQINKRNKGIMYKVTCRIFHLETKGIAHTKRSAKRNAARFMFNQLHSIGPDKLNELKLMQSKVKVLNKDKTNEKCLKIQKESNNLEEWTTAHSFRLYFTAAVNASASSLNVSVVSSPIHLLNDSNSLKVQKQQKINQEQYQIEMEQSIVQHSTNISAADRLQFLCQQLGFRAVYVCVNDLVSTNDQIDNKVKNPDEEYAVLVQVSTVPVTVTVGRAPTADKAVQIAAERVLHAFKSMLFITSSNAVNLNNNNEQSEILSNDYCFRKI
ncbi:RISC-loading complex subunit tarbp2-like isoform X2 [Daktulosphaira vitifoliae]|uniref:RISC-loading complex subunit tarbp2-like isoform X2 n=1 Tax=Daktulosphaira vitifoliae TaxID=58002 RepID=UPI0021A9B316|nr:RISC-loading complex subunit tarbp2-like isoform X2 [Daktulosphaira vitifoliae]